MDGKEERENMFEVKTSEIQNYYDIFLGFRRFKNYIEYALHDTEVKIFVNQLDKPTVAILYSKPAYFVWGDVFEKSALEALEVFTSGAWIIPASNDWNRLLEKRFNEIETHKRLLFDSSLLIPSDIKRLKTQIPDNLKIERIGAKHLEKGLIVDDVTGRFFRNTSFLEKGFGFALVDERDNVLGFALTNYPFYSNEVELYFRVGYEDYPKYRRQGLGTCLCAYFIEYCLKCGYKPIWDAANEISSHIARKFGYVEEEQWNMYHIL